MFPRNAEYEYSNSRQILMKLNNGDNLDGGVTYIKGQKGFKERDFHMNIKDLDSGTYFLFVEMEWVVQDSYSEYQFTATSYGCGQVSFIEELHDSFSREQVLEAAFLSKAQIGCDNITESNMEEKGAPNITLYNCKKSDEGYMFKLVINKENEAVYKETVEYPTFQGLTLLPPFDGNGYILEVGPGETKFAILKCDIGGYSMSMSYSQQVSLGQGALVDQCLAEGTKKERAPGISQYYLQHSAGIIYVYTNETDDKLLKEEMGFKLEGLEIEG